MTQNQPTGGSLEDMISGVLGNPSAMADLMKLAGSLGIGGKNVPGDGIALENPDLGASMPSPPSTQTAAPASVQPSSAPSQSAMESTAASESPAQTPPLLQSLRDKNAAANREKLLTALRPYLSEERRNLLDTVLKLSKLMQLSDLSALLK